MTTNGLVQTRHLIVFNEQGVSCFTNKKTNKKSYFRVINNYKIEYFLSNSTNVEIKIYNIQGELVDVITEEKKKKKENIIFTIIPIV